MKIKTADDLMFLTDGINILLKRYIESNKTEFPFIDYFMERFNFENAEVLELIAILRTTFPIKQKLKNWELFRDKSYDRTIAIGVDAEKIFRGLLN